MESKVISERERRRLFAKKAGKAAVSVALAGMLALPTVGLGASQAWAAGGFPDDDVVPGLWYVPYIQEASASGLIYGYDNGRFGPEDAVTRAQVATILCRAEGADDTGTGGYPDNGTPWSDVEDGQWYTGAMNWAYETGLFQGDAGLVRPGETITREEMAAVITRYMVMFRGATYDATGLDWPLGEGMTHDIEKVSSWAVDTMKWIANTGVMGGYGNPDGSVSLDPAGTATRAMFAKAAVDSSKWEPEEKPAPTEKHDAPARVEATGITETSVTMRTYDADGKETTLECEFSIDGGRTWQRSSVFVGLGRDKSYTVHARHVADDNGFASASVSTTFRTLGALVPARVEAQSVTDTSAEIRAYDAGGTDISVSCEFSLNDGSSWQDSNVLTGLTPERTYTVLVRVKAELGVNASSAKPVTFTTAAADPGQGTEKVWVAEYDYVQVRTAVANGLETNGGVWERSEFNLTKDTVVYDESPEVKAAYDEYMAYMSSMLDKDASYSEKWDTMNGGSSIKTYKLVPTGGHWEYVSTPEDRAKLYSYNESLRVDESIQIDTDIWTFTTQDGTFSSKKEAYAHGPIQDVRLENSSVRKKGRTLTPELMGAKAGEAWCYTGETLATMDGNPSNQR